jgi:GT2 family glycosyltransferase
LVALQSICLQTVLPGEIVIVDSSDVSISDNLEFKKTFSKNNFPKVNLVYKHTSPGLTKQRNEAIDLASGEILYFFDDDVELEPNYIEEMQKIFEKNIKYSGGMGAVTNVDPMAKFLYRSFRKIFLLQRDYSTGFFTWSGMPTHVYGTNKFAEVKVLGGCCFAFKKSVLKKEKFDESLGYYAYMEDCDISKRISDNYRFFFNPRAKLKHFHSPVARDKIVDNRAMYIKNYSYLFFKNFYPQNKFKFIFYVWSVSGLFLESLLFRKFDETKGYWRGLREFWG